MQKALEESREEFIKQFDPKSATYHGGVPENMRTNQLEWSEPPPAEVVDYGPEYTRVEKMRNDLGELKKLMVNVMPPIESVTRLKVKLATSPDDQKPKVQAQIDQDIQKRDAAINAMVKFGELEWFQPGKEYPYVLQRDRREHQYSILFFDIQRYAPKQAVIQDIAQRATLEYTNAEDLFEFGTFTKREGQLLFAEQKVLLQRLKDIKKAKQ